MLEKHVLNLPKYFKNMHKSAYVSKSLKVKYVIGEFFLGFKDKNKNFEFHFKI